MQCLSNFKMYISQYNAHFKYKKKTTDVMNSSKIVTFKFFMFILLTLQKIFNFNGGKRTCIRSEYMYNLFCLNVHLLLSYRFSVWMHEISARRWMILVFLFLIFCVWVAYMHWGKVKVSCEKKTYILT